MPRRLLALLLWLSVLTGARSACAHAAPHSILLLDLNDHDVLAELRMPVPELEAALGRPLMAEGELVVVRERDALRALLRDLHVRSTDGGTWSVAVIDLSYVQDEQGPMVVAQLVLTPPAQHSARAFTLVNDVIGKQVANHTTWVGVRHDFSRGLVSGPPSLLGITRYLHHSLLVDRAQGGVSSGVRAMFRLGTRHIAEGTDHLLFLFALLLPAPLLLMRGASGRARWSAPATVRESALKLLRIVSAFTVGHSLTLLVGALGWLRLPSAPIETLIAVSILCSAAHALKPLFPGREAWVAGGFGLVHGLAFASALSDLRLGPAHLALALLGFNLGIEAMQLTLIALCFPWLLLLAQTPAHAAFRILGALFAGCAAVGWILQRGFGLSTGVDSLMNALAAHPMGLLLGLALSALLARASSRLARAPQGRLASDAPIKF